MTLRRSAVRVNFHFRPPTEMSVLPSFFPHDGRAVSSFSGITVGKSDCLSHNSRRWEIELLSTVDGATQSCRHACRSRLDRGPLTPPPPRSFTFAADNKVVFVRTKKYSFSRKFFTFHRFSNRLGSSLSNLNVWCGDEQNY